MLKANTPLDRYLDRAAMIKSNKVRRLAGNDLRMVHNLLRMYREVNVLIAELITIKMIITGLNEKGLEYVAKNL